MCLNKLYIYIFNRGTIVLDRCIIIIIIVYFAPLLLVMTSRALS